jgi:hypothetical protein
MDDHEQHASAIRVDEQILNVTAKDRSWPDTGRHRPLLLYFIASDRLRRHVIDNDSLPATNRCWPIVRTGSCSECSALGCYVQLGHAASASP